MSNKINFIIPGLYEHYGLNIIFCTMLKAHPEYFYDNVNISAIFGNFQFSSWDGGRVFEEYHYASKELIERLVHIYNEELGIPMRLVFTSTAIKEEDCYDRYNNLVLQLCHNDMNEVVINSDILKEYIKKNYPKYTFISSTTKCLDKEALLLELDNNDYKMVCLDYNLNKNKNLLEIVSENQKEKMEFLINAICPPGCKNRENHYYLNGLYSKTYGKMFTLKYCGINNTTKNNQTSNKYVNNLSPEEVFEYNKNGFKYFKLEGRTYPTLEMILHLVNYTIKPEFQSIATMGFYSMLQSFDINTYSYEQYKNFYFL